MIKFRCYGCYKKIGMPPEMARRAVRCPKCGKSLKVPTATPVDFDEPVYAPDVLEEVKNPVGPIVVAQWALDPQELPVLEREEESIITESGAAGLSGILEAGESEGETFSPDEIAEGVPVEPKPPAKK